MVGQCAADLAGQVVRRARSASGRAGWCCSRCPPVVALPGDEPCRRPQLVEQRRLDLVGGRRPRACRRPGRPARRPGRRVRAAGGRGRRPGRRSRRRGRGRRWWRCPSRCRCRAGSAAAGGRGRVGGEPEARSSGPAGRRSRRAGPGRAASGRRPAQVAEGPAVDGRFDEVVEHLGVGDRVGQGAAVVLVVEGQLELVQASSGRPAARARALKQWSQLHTLSIQCFDISTAGPGDQDPPGARSPTTARRRRVRRPGSRTRARAPPRRRSRERAPSRLDDLVERRRGHVRRAGGLVVPRSRSPRRRPTRRSRSRPRSPLPRAWAPAVPADRAGEHGDAVAAAGLVRGEHVRVRRPGRGRSTCR